MKRLARSLITLVILIAIIFALLRFMPEEGYFTNYEKMSPAQIELGLTKMGLKDPLYVQVIRFINNILHGDLGISYRYRVNTPIAQIIAPKISISAKLGIICMVISLPIGLALGVLMARHKGLLEDAVAGVSAIKGLRDGDTVLIAEGCTHHRQCGDIGTVKIPGWLRDYTGKDLKIATCSGTEYPEDLSPYAMVVHCGGCMLNEREVRYRTKCAVDQGVPITNFGTLIACLHGILYRSLSLFPDLQKLLHE